MPEQLMPAVLTRKAEYLAARYAAKRLLRLFNLSPQLAIAHDRRPVWPAAVKGSISHCANQALVVVAKADSIWAVGVDIAQCQCGKMQQISQHIMTAQEFALYECLPFSLDHFVTLVFSAKESLFKALYPSIGTFLGFDSARLITINPLQKQLVFALNITITQHDSIINVNYCIQQDIITTLVVF